MGEGFRVDGWVRVRALGRVGHGEGFRLGGWVRVRAFGWVVG